MGNQETGDAYCELQGMCGVVKMTTGTDPIVWGKGFVVGKYFCDSCVGQKYVAENFYVRNGASYGGDCKWCWAQITPQRTDVDCSKSPNRGGNIGSGSSIRMDVNHKLFCDPDNSGNCKRTKAKCLKFAQEADSIIRKA